MAIAVPDLATLDPDEVQQTLDFISQRLGEYAPAVLRNRGVVRELVMQFAAILAAAQARVIETQVTNSSSLLKITEDPDGADPDVVDLVLSNFRLTRKDGGTASGQVAVVVSQKVPTTVPKGTRFEANGLLFETPAAYAGRVSSGAVVSGTDRLIRPLTGGDYVFTVDVVAVEPGSGGQLKRGVRLVPQSLIQNFVRAYAESDFAGGSDAETNAELIARLESGIADRSPSNRTTLDALVRNADEFSEVVATSVAGFGDAEQRRYHYLFPVAFGGRVDLYARTRPLPQDVKLTRNCTLVEKRAEGGVWQFSLARDDAPGFYEVARVVAVDSDSGTQVGYEVLELLHGLDPAADSTGFAPDLDSAVESAFTRFQTATVRFLDTDTDVTGLTTGESRADYDAIVTVLPQVAELQAFLADRERRPFACDLLVKAPVPCFLELNFTVFKKAGQADPDLGSIRADLAAYVNGLGFPGRLSAGALAAVAHARLSGGQTLSAIDMFGRILYPDGDTVYVRSYETLLIPDTPTRMVSPLTVAIYLDPVRIGITTETL